VGAREAVGNRGGREERENGFSLNEREGWGGKSRCQKWGRKKERSVPFGEHSRVGGDLVKRETKVEKVTQKGGGRVHRGLGKCNSSWGRCKQRRTTLNREDLWGKGWGRLLKIEGDRKIAPPSRVRR